MGTRLRFLAILAFAGILLAGAVAQCGGEYARLTPTPTKTPRPTFTPTPLPTNTPLPSPTPLPSDTPIPTFAPTEAPPPTAFPPPPTALVPTTAPLPTNTPPPPPPTATRKPAATATKKPTPAPTKTPAPAFTGKIVKGYARCDGFAAVTGLVKHANNSVYPDVAVGVWSDTWDGEVRLSEASGKFDVVLSGQGPGKFYVAVVELGTCSQQDGRPVARDCKRKSNVLEASVSVACSGAGANQVTEVAFTGP